MNHLFAIVHLFYGAAKKAASRWVVNGWHTHPLHWYEIHYYMRKGRKNNVWRSGYMSCTGYRNKNPKKISDNICPFRYPRWLLTLVVHRGKANSSDQQKLYLHALCVDNIFGHFGQYCNRLLVILPTAQYFTLQHNSVFKIVATAVSSLSPPYIYVSFQPNWGVCRFARSKLCTRFDRGNFELFHRWRFSI